MQRAETVMRLLCRHSVRTPDEAASLLMAVSLFAENIAMELSPDDAIRTKERIIRASEDCPTCHGVCLCGLQLTKGETCETV